MRPKLTIISARGPASFTDDQRRRLDAVADVTYLARLERLPVEELGALLKGADYAGLTPRSAPELDERLLQAAPSLRGVAIYATGYDWIDLSAFAGRGVRLSHSPSYSAISVAEHAIGLLLTLSRRIQLSHDRIRGLVDPGASLVGFELHGKTIGLVGVGRIGSRVAAMAGAMGMRVLGYDTRSHLVPGVERVDLETLLAVAEIVSLHRPLGWRQPPPFDAAALAKFRPGAVLINVSRAGLVDEAAALDAVESRHLFGYAVDDAVTDRERAARLIAKGWLVQTGHTAWYSREAVARGYEEWTQNLCALCAGAPQNVVV